MPPGPVDPPSRSRAQDRAPRGVGGSAQRCAREVLTVTRLQSGDWVLEVGHGGLALPLARRGLNVCGVEETWSLLQTGRASDADGEVLWVQQEFRRLSFRRAPFRAVLLPDFGLEPSARQQVWRACFRLLAPGGSLLALHEPHDQMPERVEYRFFPSALALALARVPETPQVRSWLTQVGCARVRTNVLTARVARSVAERLEQVRRKAMWALPLLDEDDFQRGLTALEEHVLRAPDDPTVLTNTIALTYGRKLA